MTVGQQSPDGQYTWNGSEWVPNNQQPYVQQPYPQMQYAQQPEKKRSTVKIVLITILVILGLTIGGCAAVTALFVGGVNSAIEESEAEDKKPGGPDNPLDVEVGQAFEVNGFEYQSGWTVDKDSFGDVEINGLKFLNNRDDEDSAIVEIKFWSGNEVLALADCSSDPAAVGTVVSVSCFSTDKLPSTYDRVTVNDTF